MEVTRLKRNLVGTALGRLIVRGRQLWHLWRTVRSNPEQGGFVCQDICAQLLLPKLCRSSAVFIDIGAHIGSVIAEVQGYDSSVKIVAVEAVPEKAADLARRFPDVEIHNCALGETEREVRFFVDKKRPGYSSLAQGGRSNEEVREISVPMRRLDDLISPSAQVDTVKIDVEGAELAVLRGSSDLVSRCRPVILFESGPRAAQTMGFSMEELFDWFDERDYEILVPNRVAHDGPPLHRQGFIESHYYPRRTLNYFAVPAERRIEVRDRARKALGVVVSG